MWLTICEWVSMALSGVSEPGLHGEICLQQLVGRSRSELGSLFVKECDMAKAIQYGFGAIDNEWNFMDFIYVKAHQHVKGSIETPQVSAIGKSKGENATKIHILADAHEKPNLL